MSGRKRIIFFIFFLSGMTGLVYEVIWAKFLILFIGNTAYAHTIVIAVFMGGLAIGNYFFGRAVDAKPESALRLYGILEIGIGLFAFVYIPFFDFTKNYIFLPLAAGHSTGPWITGLKFLLSFLTMIIPTILMGGTLPVLTKFFVRHLQETKREVARLYFLNSLGGVAGCLLAGFWLIPHFGIREPVWFVGALNLFLGVLVILLRSPKTIPSPLAEGGSPRPLPPSEDLSWLYLAVAASGAIAMLYEIAWIRLLSMVLGSLSYSFALMLAAFISGIALGALLLERLSPKIRRPLLWFGLLQVGVALSVTLTIPFYERLPFYFLKLRFWIDPKLQNFGLFQLAQFGFCFLLMLLPTTLSGMALPLASQVATRQLQSLGRSVGTVFSANTLGTVLGAMAAGMVLLPRLGIQMTFVLGSILSLATGALVLWKSEALSFKSRGWLIGIPALVLTVLFFIGPRLDSRILQAGVYRWRAPLNYKNFSDFKEKITQDRIHVFYREGLNASIAVEESQSRRPGALKNLFLRINGKVDADSLADLKTQLLVGHLPMILHPHPKRVLVIGFGSGMTVGAVLQYPVERVDVVEIEPAVIAAGRYFGTSNRHALKDPRLRIHLEDARTYLMLNKEKYDIIISEPSNPWIAGIGNLYTLEFYRQVEKALEPEGIFAQWFHSYENSNDLVQTLLRTFLVIFPEATLWNSQPNDYLLLGAVNPMVPNFTRMEAVMDQKNVRGDLARMQLKDLPSLLSTQIALREEIEQAVGDGPLNRDELLLFEYQQPKAFYRGEHASLMLELDERWNPQNQSLWLNQYRQANPLTAQNYLQLYQFHASPPQATRRMLTNIWQDWQQTYPLDEAGREKVRASVKQARP